MKIIDKTPFLDENGILTPLNRIQATFKFGLDWYPRMEAQARVASVLDSQLGRNFILMRNPTLGGTDIELPLILIGPFGVLLLNTIHEKGIFRAKEEEWGVITGERFVASRRNYLTLTARMGKVLQIYLDRAGFKDMLSVDAALVAANPSTHIESVRPVVRTLMLDGLERFAASLSQGTQVITPEMGARIAQVILSGKGIQADEPVTPVTPVYTPSETTYGDGEPEELSFDFQDEAEPAPENEPRQAESQPQKPGPRPSGKKKASGLTRQQQTAILVGLFVVWLVMIICFVIVYFSTAPNG